LLLAALLPARWPAAARILLPTLAGALLATPLEVAQLAVAGRVSSGWDIACNALGAMAGAAMAVAAGRAAPGRGDDAGPGPRLADPVAALLVLAWLGWRFFPYVPALDLQAWRDNLKPLLLYPAAEPVRTLALLASWTAAALLAEAAVGRRVGRWLVPAGLLAALAAEVMIPGKRLTLAEALAIGLALPAWGLLRGRSQVPPAMAAPVMAAAMLGAVLFERLEPFDFSAPLRPFGWIPFRSLIGGSMEANYQAILAKLFLQGALLWWLLRSGLRLPVAALLQAAVVLAASLAQTRLPGRSAEVTDPLLVLALAAVFYLAPPPSGDAPRPQAAWRIRAARRRSAGA
jgi:VanZ family protein